MTSIKRLWPTLLPVLAPLILSQLAAQPADEGALAFQGFPQIRALAFSPQGALFASVPDLAGGVVQVFGPKLSKSLAKTAGAPAGLAFDREGSLYVADPGRKAILKITPWGELSVAAERCAGKPLVSPADVTAGASGIYFTDSGSSRVCRLAARGAAELVSGAVVAPTAIATCADGSCLIVGDRDGSLWRLGPRGEAPRKIASAGGEPAGIALDERGNAYVAATGAGKVSVVSPEGRLLTELSVPATDLSDVTFGAADRASLFVADSSTGAIFRLKALHASQPAVWERDKPLRITEPIDGAILNRHDGAVTGAGLKIQIKGAVQGRRSVRVNGAAASVQNGEFRAEVLLKDRVNRIVAESPGGLRDEVTVLWDRDSFPRYRFSVDDNIRFLNDIALHEPPYTSVFENVYLGFWREMHRKYGAKVHFNIYYEMEGFTLARMPERFRREWQQNAGWIRLTFHARANSPDRPYVHSTAQRIRDDYRLVTREIERFAGKGLLSEVTTIHWGDTTEAAAEALTAEGVKVLIGYFDLRRELPAASYYVTMPQLLHLMGRDYWKDTRRDLLFVRHDMVINNVPLEQIVPRLERLAADPHQSEVIELMIHEQYFHPDYVSYEPDYRERVECAIRWVTERGYKPVFYGEGFLGAPAPQRRSLR